MKKIIAIASASLLALAFAAPVAADTVVDGNVTEKLVPAASTYEGFIAVCTYPGDKASNWLVNGGGLKCIEGTSPNSPDGRPGMLKVLPEAALGGMIVE